MTWQYGWLSPHWHFLVARSGADGSGADGSGAGDGGGGIGVGGDAGGAGGDGGSVPHSPLHVSSHWDEIEER